MCVGGGGEGLKRLCGLIKIFLSPFWGDFGQELFRKACHAYVILRTKGENWDGTYFKMGVGTRCSEYSEWTLHRYRKTKVQSL